MEKAVVLYNSKTGITKKFAEEISNYLSHKGLSTVTVSIVDFKKESLDGAKYLFLGCWTSGLFLFAQKPDKNWVEFSKQLPNLDGFKTGLFTTYKLATGSMFKIMRKHLDGKLINAALEIKSRNGMLSDENKLMLDKMI